MSPAQQPKPRARDPDTLALDSRPSLIEEHVRTLRLQVELPRFAAPKAGLRRLATTTPSTPQPLLPRRGLVIATITAVLEHADQPLRARDIHATAQALLGRPLNWSSVKATLAEHTRTPNPRFERTGHGRYRWAHRSEPQATRPQPQTTTDSLTRAETRD
jgi:hypothetical protein